MQKTRIEWMNWPDGRPGYSWNPIKGLCPVGCWYCYARKIYKRFGERIMSNYEVEEGGSTISLEDTFLFDPQQEKFPKHPSRIFACSTFELFHPDADRWRDEIFKVISSYPEHTFFILTKLPQNIDRPIPENVWFGITLDGQNQEDIERAMVLEKLSARLKFISYEPLLGASTLWPIRYAQWVIIGRLTGHGEKHNPSLTLVEKIVGEATYFSVPVFLKNNLSGIWPGKLIQNFPNI